MKIWLPTIRGNSGTDVFTRRLAEALTRHRIVAEISWFHRDYQLAPFLLRKVPAPPGTTIVHTNSWNGFAFKRPGIPLVVTEHLPVLDAAYRRYKNLLQHIFHHVLVRYFEKASFRGASAITAVSRFVASSLAETLGIETACVIPNWIDTATFFPNLDPPSHPSRPFRLLFVGNLSRRKGADMLSPIMRELGPDFELRFTRGLGDPTTFPRLENMIPLGRLNGDQALVQAYHACDALLFPSRFEGLPLAPIEAMACGKPVIASRTSSLPELIEHEVSGLLCPPDDVALFVSAARHLAHPPELSRQYGRAARRRIEEHFSEEQIVPQYTALYRKLA